MKPTRKALIAIFTLTFLQLVAGFMLLPWLLYRISENGVSGPCRVPSLPAAGSAFS